MPTSTQMKSKKNLHGILGVALLVCSEILMLKGIEPFASWFYYCAWWSYILIVDSLIYTIKKNSLIMNRGGEFLLMLFWSVFIWTFFEAVNLVLKNWYYVNVVAYRFIRWPGYAFAYATVLPGVFETTELLESLGVFKKSRVKPLTVNRYWIVGLLTLGIVSLGGVLLYPTYCFPLTWGFLIFLLEPINYLKGGTSILREWERGTLRKFYLLLLAGFICGALWEFWNFWAVTKWIYTVPFFEELKLFEMPVLGFLGFPPFTVECYVFYNFISLFRYQRGWEEDTYGPNQGKRVKFPFAVGTFIAVSLFCLLTFSAMDEKTVNSYWPDVGELQMMRPEVLEYFASRGITTPHALLATIGSAQGKKELAQKCAISESEITQWVHLAQLSLVKGMGTRNAYVLTVIGVESFSDLAAQDPALLYDKLVTLAKEQLRPKGTAPPREAIVRLWVREARKKASNHQKVP